MFNLSIFKQIIFVELEKLLHFSSCHYFLNC